MDFTSFSSEEYSFVLDISMHAHQILFVRNTHDQGQTASMTYFEDFISTGWINTVAERVIRHIHYSLFMCFYTNYILIPVRSNDNHIYNTVLQACKNSFWSRVIGNTHNFLRETLWPLFNKSRRSVFGLPGLNATYFHELSSFVLPRKFGVCHFGVKSWYWTHICCSDQESLLIFQEDVVSDTLTFSLNGILEKKLRRIYYNIRSIFVEL